MEMASDLGLIKIMLVTKKINRLKRVVRGGVRNTSLEVITLAQVRENEALFSPDGNAFSLIASSKTEECQVNFISRSLICCFCKWSRPLFFQNYISLSSRHLSISTGANLTPLWAGANISSLSYPSFIASFKDLFGLHAQLPFPSSSAKE